MKPKLTPQEAMLLAIEEGRKGWGRVHPNPQVGCVILNKDGELLSTGYHAYFGGPHAEVEALQKIEDSEVLKGAKVYVTLEPCAHQGKTPACAKTLGQLPISEVVYGVVDPNPLVARKGIEILESGGIRVRSIAERLQELGDAEALQSLPRLIDALEELAEHFLWNHRHKKPFVALKVATTLDGVMAHRSGQSQWITGEESRREVHRLRAGFAAVAIGKNTFIQDNPSLNIRHPDFLDIRNKVVVFDSKGETLSRLAKSNMWLAHKPEDIYWVTASEARSDLKSQGDELGIHILSARNMEEALGELFKNNVHSLFVEGGSHIYSHFIQHGLAQRLYQFIAPQIAGGRNGLQWTSQVDFAWSERPTLRAPSTQRFGNDILITGRMDPAPYAK